MDNNKLFGTLMAGASCISLLFILFHLLRLCFFKKLRNFSALLISTLLFCDLFTIIGAFLRFGLSLSGNSEGFCKGGVILFYTSSYGCFLCSLALVITISTSTSSRVRIRNLSEKRSFVVSLYAGVWISAVILSAITVGLKFRGEDCQANTGEVWIYYATWLFVTVANMALLLALFLRLRSVSIKSRGFSSHSSPSSPSSPSPSSPPPPSSPSSPSAPLPPPPSSSPSYSSSSSTRFLTRIVMGIAVVIGFIRIPAFVIAIVSPGSISYYLDSPNPAIVGCFMFAFVLTVLQPTFVVLVVGYNQGAFSFCRCGASLSSSLNRTSDVTVSKSGDGSTPGRGSSFQLHENDVQMA